MKKNLSVAVGLVAVAALLASGCAGHVKGMKDVRWLTDEEKARVVEIALATPEAAAKLAEYGPEYQADLGWVSIVWGKDGQYSEWRGYEYDIVATGLPRGEKWTILPDGTKMVEEGVPESAEIYSWVVTTFGDPPKWQVYVAVNPNTNQVAFVQENPFNTGPQRQIQ